MVKTISHKGQIFKTEKRPAVKGEKVVITKGDGHYIKVGEIAEAYSSYDIRAYGHQFRDSRSNLANRLEKFSQYITHEKYEVLVPMSLNEVQISSIESRIATIEKVLAGLKEEMDELKKEKGQAKEFIDRVTRYRKDLQIKAGNFPDYLLTTRKFGSLRFEYHVNEQKRTVVALGYLKYSSRKSPVVRGIAKCHPTYKFNEEIGKAIAIVRALEEPLPEFLQTI